MAFQAAGALLFRIVEVVIPASVLFSQVAAVTKGITVYENLPAVWFMAIGTNHTSLVHLALQKGGIYIYFLKDLPVRKIQSLFKQGRVMCFEE